MRSAFIFLIALSTLSASAKSSQGPFYSRMALYVPGYSSGHLTSPDGQFVASLTHTRNKEGDDFAYVCLYRKSTGKLIGKVATGLGLDEEMMWSPDSKSLALTWSEAGGNGPYVLTVLTVKESTMKQIPLTPLVYRTFGHPYACGWPEDPNVGGIRWLSANRLVVAAEVVAHSVCDNFGTFFAYEIDLPTLKVVRTYNQLQAKKSFGTSLGWELANAPDECWLKPHSCEMDDNKDERKRRLAASSRR